MKHSIRTSLAVAALVAASAIALPTAAHAVTSYPDALAWSGAPTTLAAGATTMFSREAEWLVTPGETTIMIEGETSTDIGVVKFAVTSATSDSGSLPATGIDSSSLLGLWVGAGALILVGGTLAIATTVRRNRKQAGV